MPTPTADQFRARRKKIIDEMRDIDAAADPETGSLSPEQEAAFAALKEALAKLEIAITRAETLEGVERRSPGVPLDGIETRTVRIGGRDAQVPAAFDGTVLTTQDGHRVPVLEARHRLRDFVPAAEQRGGLSFGGFLRALYSGPRDDLERRALAEATIGSGGALVPTPLSMQVIDLLRSKCVAFEAGAKTVPMDSQTLRFAQEVQDPVGGWRAELAPIVQSNPVFNSVTLSAKSWALIVPVSRELLEDGQNLDAVLQNIFARTAALALDRAILYGDGTNNSPVGIASTPGIQVVTVGGANGGSLTSRGPLLDAVLALESANVPDITAAVMSPRSARTLNGLVDTLGQPLRPPPSLENVPMLTTTSASVTETQGTSTNASSVLIGDFSQVWVGMRTALQITILQERFADVGQVGFVLWMRADVLVQHPAALARIEGITP